MKPRERALDVFDRERLTGGKEECLEHFFQVEGHAGEFPTSDAAHLDPRNHENGPVGGAPTRVSGIHVNDSAA